MLLVLTTQYDSWRNVRRPALLIACLLSLTISCGRTGTTTESLRSVQQPDWTVEAGF
ncbi:MAG: hypothetical protein M0P22_12125 [Methanoculleus sp.]|nr:hypothetical protein [Methanoculleus sp.]